MKIAAKRRKMIEDALLGLSPDTPEHWQTGTGRPLPAAVSEVAGVTVSKAEIDAVDPTLTRDLAAKRDAERLEALTGDRGVPATPTDTSAEEPQADTSAEEPQADTPAEEPQAEESVLGLPQNVVLASPELLLRARREINARTTQIAKERNALLEEEQRLSALNALVDQRLDALGNPEVQTLAEQVKAMQARTQAARAKRHANAQTFLKAGTSPQDVLAALDPRSQIDRALNTGKPGFGSRRPTPRTPAGSRG